MYEGSLGDVNQIAERAVCGCFHVGFGYRCLPLVTYGQFHATDGFLVIQRKKKKVF